MLWAWVVSSASSVSSQTSRVSCVAWLACTHAVICTGSCLIQLVSVYGYAEISGYDTNRDPSRLAAQAVSGIGFVGAGAILKGGTNVIYGLTSAASIWLAMGVGLAVGLGYWAVTSLTVVLVVIAMVVTKKAEDLVFGRRYGPGYQAEMEVVSKGGTDILQHIIDRVGKLLNLTTISIDRRHKSDTPRPQTKDNRVIASSTPSAPTAPPTPLSEVPSSPAATSLSPVEQPPGDSLLCAKFVVELSNCSKQSFLCRLQLTVLLLCEDEEVVYKVDSRNVQELREGPTHRLEWSVPSKQESEQMERQMDKLKAEVRQRRLRRGEELRVSGGGADVEGENAVPVDVR